MKKNNWNKEELNKLYHIDGKTLVEIGAIYGVSRERVRQVMREFNLPPGRNQSQRIRERNGMYSSLADYLASLNGKRDCSSTLNRYANKLFCSECGHSNGNKKWFALHIHHIRYPATSLDDIQILCASCHYTKHRRGISFAKQLDIFNEYNNGITTIELTKKYEISRILIYKIITKIKNGHSSLRG